jgi:hypothetical protein
MIPSLSQKNFMLKLRTYLRLGLKNILRVAVYRIGLKTGLHPVVRVKRTIEGDRFFRPADEPDDSLEPQSAWQDKALFFGWYEKPLGGGPPDWHENPFTGVRFPYPDRPWWKIPDFDSGVGDIKAIWEASRFDWVLAFAQRAKTGRRDSLERLNDWLSDWCRANSAYLGPNWKCGQEASIRVIQLAAAAMILGQEKSPEKDLVDLVETHLARIYPTISYAVAQDNNHGTSEAAALFIGGSWCAQQGRRNGGKWASAGRKWLENRGRRLIEPDGSFSQHSVNYHRLMLDTSCMAELWRRRHGLDKFSQLFYERSKAAASWLHAMAEPESGDAPNLGSNDGARLMPLTDADYRDYRPSVALAMALFAERGAYGNDGYQSPNLAWLGEKTDGRLSEGAGSKQFDHGGYCVLRNGSWMSLFRYPRYRFRPGHCDALHVELWYGAFNLLRDGGSYSYNTEEKWQDYFPGMAAHNTVQFDSRASMPKVSRFLRGNWLQAEDVEALCAHGGGVTVSAGYCDWKGARHHRKVRLHSDGLRVEDRVSGFAKRAVLRWRLAPGNWRVEGTDAVLEGYLLKVSSNVDIVRCEIVEGWESRYYMNKEPLPVLEAEIRNEGSFFTEFTKKQS